MREFYHRKSRKGDHHQEARQGSGMAPVDTHHARRCAAKSSFKGVLFTDGAQWDRDGQERNRLDKISSRSLKMVAGR